jgi:hypothetical protein
MPNIDSIEINVATPTTHDTARKTIADIRSNQYPGVFTSRNGSAGRGAATLLFDTGPAAAAAPAGKNRFPQFKQRRACPASERTFFNSASQCGQKTELVKSLFAGTAGVSFTPSLGPSIENPFQ